MIPTFIGGESLARTVASLTSILSPKDEIVVVWDNQAPQSLDFRDGRVRQIEWHGRRGFATACNHGATRARGGSLLFLNDDVVVRSPRVLEVLGATLDVPRVGLAGPDVLSRRLRRSESGTSLLWHHGVLESRQGPLVGTGLVPVDYVCGAALAVRAAVFRELGGFDERLAPYYWEDADLALRARRRGLRAVVAADVRVVHEHGTTINLEDERIRRQIFERNRIIVTLANLTLDRWPRFLFWLPLRYCRHVVRDRAVARGIIVAMVSGLGSLEEHATRD